MNHRPRDRQPLLLADAHLVGLAVQLVRQTDHVQNLLDPSVDRLALDLQSQFQVVRALITSSKFKPLEDEPIFSRRNRVICDCASPSVLTPSICNSSASVGRSIRPRM
jgi:hypothetical protein